MMPIRGTAFHGNGHLMSGGPSVLVMALTSPRVLEARSGAAAAGSEPAPAPPTHMSRAARRVVYAWGCGAPAALGGVPLDSYGVAAFPRVVRGLPGDVAAVAAGEACSAALTDGGDLYTWGAGRAGRLGHGDGHSDAGVPTRVALGVRVAAVSVGDCHVACVSVDGRAFAWGNGAHGALGDGRAGGSRVTPAPMCRAGGAPVMDALPLVACGTQTTGLVCASGGLHTCGWGTHGRLGHGDTRDRACLAPVGGALGGYLALTSVAMGSLFSAATTADGAVYTWGYGAHGNLGHGDRRGRLEPTRVEALVGVRVVSVHATVGQPTVASGTGDGSEGPHCVAVDDAGALWSWGTCHKGILGNLRHKTLCASVSLRARPRLAPAPRFLCRFVSFVCATAATPPLPSPPPPQYDCLIPYRVGGACADDPRGGASGYLHGVRVVQVWQRRSRVVSCAAACLTPTPKYHMYILFSFVLI